MDDVLPPWIVVRDLKPEDSATQGAGATYYDLSFVPFWRSLTFEQKDAYLDRWNASLEWRQAIAFKIDHVGIDLEADARESEEWRATRVNAKVARLPWWKRLLDRR